MSRRRWSLCFAALLLFAAVGAVPAAAHPDHNNGDDKTSQLTPSPLRLAAMAIGAELAGLAQPTSTSAPCIDGDAAGYPCEGVDLLAVLPLADLDAVEGNDLWGWTHGPTGREFALFGHSAGTAFVEVTDPTSPVYLGTLPTRTSTSIWRDLKVHDDHVFVVSEAAGHGMQVLDLTALLDVAGPPVTFTADADYGGFGNAHNLVINEDTAYAYAVGTDTCGGGLHMIDISTPQAPVFAGCFADDGYTHDAQCVIYAGPDIDYTGNELCFAANEDTFTIVDVTDKAKPRMVVRQFYIGTGYSHQGWLTPDHRYFLLDDELDEWANGSNTRTFIWDVADLGRPHIVGTHVGPTAAIDHNQYVVGAHTYQANYRAGLRILDVTDVASGTLEEVGFFDIYPASDGAGFNGAWSVYPWFSDGVVAISGIEQGLFLVRFEAGAPDASAAVHIHDLAPKPTQLDGDRWRARAVVTVRDAAGSPVAGAAVSGFFGTGKHRVCTTNAAGKCKVKVKIADTRSKIPFTIGHIETPGGYDPEMNRDAVGGDSDGTRIVIRQPAA